MTSPSSSTGSSARCSWPEKTPIAELSPDGQARRRAVARAGQARLRQKEKPGITLGEELCSWMRESGPSFAIDVSIKSDGSFPSTAEEITSDVLKRNTFTGFDDGSQQPSFHPSLFTLTSLESSGLPSPTINPESSTASRTNKGNLRSTGHLSPVELKKRLHDQLAYAKTARRKSQMIALADRLRSCLLQGGAGGRVHVMLKLGEDLGIGEDVTVDMVDMWVTRVDSGLDSNRSGRYDGSTEDARAGDDAFRQYLNECDSTIPLSASVDAPDGWDAF